jgi:hypothetical protein
MQGPEALAEPDGVQRRAQAGRHDGLGAAARGEQVLQVLPALDAADRRSVRRPFHLFLVVGGDGQASDLGRPVRRQVRRAAAARFNERR